MGRANWLALALTTTALVPVGVARSAPVLPTGGQVTAGSAVIGSPAAGALTVSQSSGKAIVDWGSFSIGQGGTVNFANGSGATLNRVTGTSLSSLDGLLTATGSVYLLNPNGVVVGKTGVVDVGGRFVASTLGLSNDQFLTGGDLTFSGPSTASVVNLGKIGSLGGDVALIATTVRNEGSISASQGAAGLLAGSQVLVRDAALDGGRFAVLVGGAGTSATNAGTIEAATAELRANGGDVYALAGDTAGVIRATGVSATDGRVFLTAEGGTTHVAGTLEAQGPNGAPGQIETSGATLDVGSAKIDAHGGAWLLDPTNLEITAAAATTVSNALATTDVTEQTTATGASGTGTQSSGAGDITLDGGAAISWASTHALTLSAYRNVAINGTVRLTGAGALNLVTDNAGAGNGGTLLFNGGAVQFNGLTAAGLPTGSLAIGVGKAAPASYTLVADLATLSADIAANNTGRYALTGTVDGSNGGIGYTASPLTSTVATPFAGTLEGLGNTVANLTIRDTTNTEVGLFGQIAPGGVVRDLSLTGGSVSGAAYTAQGVYTEVGALAGLNQGAVTAVNGSAVVSLAGYTPNASNQGTPTAGGLVGANLGQIASSFATGDVSSAANATVGGLVGFNGERGDQNGIVPGTGVVTGSYATGTVTESPGGPGFAAVGGLVGENVGAVNNAYASGSVAGPGGVGGLAGVNFFNNDPNSGIVRYSYATGSVTGGDGSRGGGLVGNNTGLVEFSYASGAVTGGAGAYVGGLVGFSDGSGNVGEFDYSYATGAVTGGANAVVGGLAGEAKGSGGFFVGGVFAQGYATGAVTGGLGSQVGGLFGYTFNAKFQSLYFDPTTAGVAKAVGRSDNGNTYTNVGAIGSAGAFSTAGYAGLNFGTAPGGAPGFVIVDANGTLNNAGGAAGGTRPILLGEYATTIADAHQLQLMALDPTANYTLAGDVDASKTAGGDVWGPGGFVPVGGNDAANYSVATKFTGSLAGQGHTISGLTINNTADVYVGLFGRIGAGATVSNLTIDATVSAGQPPGPAGADVGVLAGFSMGTITGVTTQGSIFGSDPAHHLAVAGGLIGDNNGPVTGSSSSVSVSDGLNGGGLVGLNDYQGVIASSSADGSVNAGSAQSDQYQPYDIGGLVGTNYGSVGTSSAGAFVNGGTTTAAGHNSAGGLVGALVIGSIADSHATGLVVDTTARDQVGGLVGFVGQSVSVTRTYATGQVQGGAGGATGGLAGTVLNGSTVSQSYASGAVSGPGGGSLGGLVGSNAGIVSNDYAIGSVTNAGSTVGGTVGGLVGANTGTVSGAWASGTVVGGATAGEVDGGFAGSSSGTITAGYYDQGTTAQATGVGGVADATSGVGAVGGTTGLSPYSAASYPKLQFGTTPGGSASQAFVIVDADSTLNNAGGAAGGTRPFLLSEYSLNVGNAHQLQLMNLTLGAAGAGLTYTLTGDVDATSTSTSSAAISSDLWASDGFVPIGQVAGTFIGFHSSFDGAGHSVSNLYENTPIGMATTGLFGLIDFSNTGYSVISNVALYNVAITGGGQVGGLVGESIRNSGLFSNISVSGTVRGLSPNANVGGVIGLTYLDNSNITNVHSQTTVSGGVGSTVGGIAGSGALLTLSDSSGAVTGGSGAIVGGLIGSHASLISLSHATGTVTGGDGSTVGGLVGIGSFESNSYATGAVVGGAGAKIGGLAGTQSGSVTASYATGLVSGGTGSLTGGLIGEASGTTQNTYATGAVNGAGGSSVGGLIGQQDSGFTLTNAYALGAVTVAGSDGAGKLGLAGGLIGSNAGTIRNAYATGKVSGGGDNLQTLGGLVGANTGQVAFSYWDTRTTGQATDAATSTTGAANGSTGLTTAQFMDPTSPIGGLGLGTTPGGAAGFVIVDADGGFNGAGGAAGATRPFLLSEAPTVQTVPGFGALASVTNAHQLQLMGLNLGATYIVQTADDGALDASATAAANPSDMWGAAGFVPIGSGAAPFTGRLLDVGGIDGLTVNKAGSYAGLVGALGAGGQVSARLTHASVTGGGYVGGLVGDNFGTVSGSVSGAVGGPGGTGGLVGVNEGGSTASGSVTGTVTGAGNDVGGIAGANFGTLRSAFVSGTVSGTGDHVGGLVGYNAGSIQRGTVSGSVNGAHYVGGAVGLNYGPVSASSFSQTVTGAEYVGGLVGWNTQYGAITGGTVFGGSGASSGSVTAQGDYAGGLVGVNKGAVTASSAATSVGGAHNVGGLVGLNQGSVSGSSSTGGVTGGQAVGGLVGGNDTGATISKSFATGQVTGVAGGQDPTTQDDYVGGLIGVNFGQVSDVYATGAVSGVQVVGGLVGTNMPGGASITNAYSTGLVTASRGAAGGFAGIQAGKLTSTYFEPSTSGQALGVGYAVVQAAPTAIGPGVACAPGASCDPKAQATYQGFDFTNTWQANTSAPPTLKGAPGQ